jgi:hypothetical protein
LNGSSIPLPATRAEARAKGDPRRSLEERYPTPQAYADAVKRAVDGLVKDRLLLPEDASEQIERAKLRAAQLGSR